MAEENGEIKEEVGEVTVGTGQHFVSFAEMSSSVARSKISV
jgi:hypothetical protein